MKKASINSFLSMKGGPTDMWDQLGDQCAPDNRWRSVGRGARGGRLHHTLLWRDLPEHELVRGRRHDTVGVFPQSPIRDARGEVPSF